MASLASGLPPRRSGHAGRALVSRTECRAAPVREHKADPCPAGWLLEGAGWYMMISLRWRPPLGERAETNAVLS